jgi:hypothetical protein
MPATAGRGKGGERGDTVPVTWFRIQPPPRLPPLTPFPSQVRCALHLCRVLRPYVEGRLEAFEKFCATEAGDLGKRSLGPAILRELGAAYQLVGHKYLGALEGGAVVVTGGWALAFSSGVTHAGVLFEAVRSLHTGCPWGGIPPVLCLSRPLTICVVMMSVRRAGGARRVDGPTQEEVSGWCHTVSPGHRGREALPSSPYDPVLHTHHPKAS